MHILVLDDNSYRHDVFDGKLDSVATIEHAWSYQDAIALLESQKFDLAYLDHDLNDEGLDDECGREMTGADVARFIAKELDIELRPERVIVHSWNPSGASAMVAILRSCGVQCMHEPFTD